ncbi:MAG: 6,7-dimethyl-8-ribityllumazine synthase [Actinomycetes bacterium]
MGVDFSDPRSADRPVPDGAGRKIGIVVTEWNDVVTRRLLRGASDVLTERNVAADDVEVVWVPGAFEVPLAAKTMATTGRFDAVVCLGCVIRGDTTHYEYVAGPAAYGIMQAQMDTGVPVIFGVLTVENQRQALVRSVVDGDVSGDNKGAEAVETALRTIAALGAIRST